MPAIRPRWHDGTDGRREPPYRRAERESGGHGDDEGEDNQQTGYRLNSQPPTTNSQNAESAQNGLRAARTTIASRRSAIGELEIGNWELKFLGRHQLRLRRRCFRFVQHERRAAKNAVADRVEAGVAGQ